MKDQLTLVYSTNCLKCFDCGFFASFTHTFSARLAVQVTLGEYRLCMKRTHFILQNPLLTLVIMSVTDTIYRKDRHDVKRSDAIFF